MGGPEPPEATPVAGGRTLIGGITLFLVGQLIFRVIFAGFLAANVGSATGVSRDAAVYWALALGNLSLAALLTLTIGWARATSIAQGFKVAAIVGFLVWLGVDFIHYGISNVGNLTATIADPLLEMIHNGIAGAAIVVVTRRLAPSGA